MGDNSYRFGIGIVSAALLGVLGCGSTTPPPPSAPPKTPTVTIIHPERKSLRRVVEQPGTVQASEETQLYARVPGYVRRLTHDIGNEVESGEVLAELVVPELVEEVAHKQALVRQADAEGEQAAKALAAATATIAVAQAAVVETQAASERWESESKRMTALAKERIVDTQAAEEAVNQFRAAGGKLASAKASVDKAKADRDRADADVRVARSRVDAAAAALRVSEAQLGYAKIRAPFDGKIVGRKVSTGTFVQPGGQGDWLFTVARVDPVRVVIAVPEADAELVKEKAEVRLTVPALNGSEIVGTVARTSWALEMGARTLRTEIDLPNKDRRLRPAMYVHARIINQLPEAWTLPVAAVVKQGEATVCFLVEDGKAVRTPVRLGRSDGQFVQVFQRRKAGSVSEWEEFTRDDRVAARAAGLNDGQPVQTDTPGK